MKNENQIQLLGNRTDTDIHLSEIQSLLKVVSEIGKQISVIDGIDELCFMTVSLVQNLLNYDFVAIWLLEANGNTLVLSAVSSPSHNSAEIVRLGRDSKNHSVVRAWQTGEYCFAMASHAKAAQGENPISKSSLAIPILNLNDTLAVLEIHQAAEQGFDYTDSFLLEILVNQISAAIRNARLFRELETAKEAAEIANRLKSQFLASMSNTLRAPLTMILNWTEFMQSGVLGKVNKEQADVLRILSSNAEQVMKYINDGLDISKIKRGKLLLSVEDVDISVILHNSCVVLASSVAKKPIRIISEIAPDLPRIRGDQRRLQQVLLNLVSNAAKFTHTGTINLIAWSHKGKICLVIRDTGIGIAPEVCGTIFEQDTQIHHGADSGFGLPLTKQIVEAHGGSLSFETELGKGTSFYLELHGLQDAE